MLPEDGSIVAQPTVTPEAWSHVLPAESMPLVLAPGSTRGWFGGQAVIAFSPSTYADGLSRDEAAATLERTLAGRAPGLAVALLRYDGAAVAASYPGGLVLTANGWRAWGTLRSAPPLAAALARDTEPPLAAAAARNPAPPPDMAHSPLATHLVSDLDAAAFRAGVRATAEAIRAGDVYVLNLTRRLQGRPAMTPPEAFEALRARTEADMSAIWCTAGRAIVSASPERFLRILGGRAEIWPIKGTRPRADGAADREMAAELAASEKERAEHVMIVDLERNDLGRVCRAGTIRVDRLLEVVATPYCHQMVSRISGQLCEGVPLAEVLDATFPCGSVTGAPKIAAMREIARLERSPRGAYTGAFLVATHGHLDSSVLIRTAEYEGSHVRWGTGCGITVDSDPHEEWAESVLKSAPFAGWCTRPGTRPGTRWDPRRQPGCRTP